MEKVFQALKKSGLKIFGPKEQDGELHILELENPPQKSPPAPLFKRGGAKGGSSFLPPLQRGIEGDFVFLRPWKYFFMPTRETLYKYEGGRPKIPPQKFSKRALFGMSYFDCKALELYDMVFGASPFGKGLNPPVSPFAKGEGEGDLYYQQNRKNIFVIGYSPVPLAKIKTPFFEVNLGSAVFDIFIEGSKLYARGKQAEKILKSAGLKYKVVPYKKHEPDKKVLAITKAMEASAGSKMWDELGEICLACGKCTIACPTCYCFDLESVLGPDHSSLKLRTTGCQTERCSGNCFYDDFTRIAGPPAKAGEPSGHKFLNSPKEKIYFWYYHKFVRIPFGYGLPGCTDCGRCTAVCPVGINIKKNIERLLKESKKK